MLTPLIRIEAGGPALAPPVRYHSRGCLLVAGPSGRVLPVLERLTARLTVLALISDGAPAGALPGARIVPGRLARVEGHLGAFRAFAADPRALLDLGPLSANRDERFDLVLDLSERPVLRHEVLPPGYHAPGAGPEALETAIGACLGQVGEFGKARYFDLQPGRCAHQVQSVAGCHRCLEACPAGAIRPGAEAVRIDAQLCQGCGGCALVCPGGAVRYREPSPRVTQERIRAGLSPGAELLIHERDWAPPARPSRAEVLVLRVHALGSVGIETWLAALAWGASRVLLARPPGLPPSTRRVLEEQVSLAARLLEGLGLEPGRVAWCETGDDRELPPLSGSPSLTVEPRDDKREVLFAALDHLYRQSRGPAEPVALSAGSPLGAITVGDSCTSCMACVNLCPAGALERGPQASLRLVEGRCLQCGVCEAGCPERAIRLIPRALLDPEARGRPRTLREADLARCVECGAPFASRALVERSLRELAGHPQFQGAGERRLRMCPACRSKATMLEAAL